MIYSMNEDQQTHATTPKPTLAERGRLMCTAALMLLTASISAAHAQSTQPATQPTTQTAAQTAKAPSAERRLANNYGFDQWDQVAELNFTFDVKLPNGKHVVRHWAWDTQAQKVTRRLPDGSELTFTPYQPENEAQREADQQFINDTYWLLFPFQLVWSRPAIAKPHQFAAELPIGDGRAPTWIVRYANDQGYTPGDTYVLYLNNKGLIKQWEFIRNDNRRPATWERHVKLGPLTISTLHRNADGSFEMNLLDGLAATLTDGTKVKPEPIDEGEE